MFEYRNLNRTAEEHHQELLQTAERARLARATCPADPKMTVHMYHFLGNILVSLARKLRAGRNIPAVNVKRSLLVVLVFASLAMKPLGVQASPARRPETFPDKVEDGAEALIEATVQIRTGPSGRGDEAQIGLGTLVASGDQTFLITHNHWPPSGRSDRVEFLTAQGEFLLELSRKDFDALVVCEDSGSLILRSPLPGDLPAALLGTAGELKADDILRVAYLKGDSQATVWLLAGRLEEISRHKGIPVFQLRLPSGEMPGPGTVGGIWLDGKLVGQAWELKPYARWSVVRMELPGLDADDAAPSAIELLLMQPAHLLPSSFQVG